MRMKIELKGVTKKFGAVTAVNNVSLQVQDGDFVALLGPSGCGKTTILFLLTGIYKLTSGEMLFDGKSLAGVLPKDRDIGMVFQSYALYPHMSVYKNLTFPLVLKKTPKAEMTRKAQGIAEKMGIGHLLDRKPVQLSGGQQQRVALGRALIKEPKLLLFDEPLSNLDARLRISMREEIKKIHEEFGITSIYVTHDQIEAMTLASKIAVLSNGVLQAYGTPDELHNRPVNEFIAEFIGNPPMNLFEVKIAERQGNAVAVLDDTRELRIPEARRPRAAKGRVKMGIRPHDIKIDPQNGFDCRISMVEPMGRDNLIRFSVGKLNFHSLTDPAARLKAGDTARLKFDMEQAQYFDAETGESLLWK
jgi:ABC-type sugar transport system ATPase subunit